MTTFSLEEVAKHNTENDLWIIYNDGVYDITKFYTEHPGGEEILLNLAGKDSTQCFDDIGHSEEAIILRETFKIGTVGGGTAAGETVSSSPSSGEVQNTTIDDDNSEYKPQPNSKPTGTTTGTLLLGAMAVAIYAYIAYYFLSS